MKLTLIQKSIFGVDRLYPVDEISKVICKLMNKRTFNDRHMMIFKQAGWDVEIKYY